MKLPSKMTQAVTSLALISTLALAGCSAGTSSSTSATSSAVSTATSTSAAGTSSTISYDTHYSSSDTEVDTSSAVKIDLSNPTATEGVTVENGVITITAAGTYELSGSYSGQIVVNAGDEDVVTLVLNNATISNSSGPALYIQNANEAVIYTASGTSNTIEDGSSYSATGTDDPDAALYSASDLTLAGEGSLTVTGNYGDAISSADGLVIASGTLNVTAADDGIKGKDYVDILSGTITVQATSDGIKSTNSTDAERGWVRLSGGTVTINAGDDGFKAEKELEINAGSLDIQSSTEGIEAQYVIVVDGQVQVTSSDDGINATAPDSSSTESTTSHAGPGGGAEAVEDASISILGGTTTVDSEGDSLDSNGTAELSGGTLILHGPSSNNSNSSTDIAGTFSLTGGTLLAGGATGMMSSGPNGDHTQGYILTNVSGLSAGDTVTVKDSSGNTVATYEVTKDGVQELTISTPDMVAGESYTLSSGSTDLGTVTAQ